MLCLHDPDEKTGSASFAIVLNPQIMHMASKENTSDKIPEVCLVQHNAKVKSWTNCRRTFCPTGKIRNANSHCVLVGDILNTGGFSVQIKLTPRIPDYLDQKGEKAIYTHLVQNIMETNPWPKDWKLQTIFVRDDDTVCEEKGIIIVNMASPEKPTQAKYDNIERSIKLPWPIRKRSTANFSQSFLEYKLKVKVGESFKGSFLRVPSWQAIQTNSEDSGNYLSCGPIQRKSIHKNSHMNQLLIKKLYICDQIQLQAEEFNLGDGNTILKSNLTKRILYDLEFELIEDINGVQARVCLSDTIFTAKQSNDEKSLHTSAVAVQTHGFIILIAYLSHD